MQTLYALNRTYFPSWKRAEQYIASFRIKPENCYERIRKAIKLSAEPETIEACYEVWRKLVEELEKTCGGELSHRRIALWRPAPKGFRVIFSGWAESMMQVIINESGALLLKSSPFLYGKKRGGKCKEPIK